MASQRRPGSTNQTPLPVPVPAASRCSGIVNNQVVLYDWWLQRLEGEEGKLRVAGYTTSEPAGPAFFSAAIVRRPSEWVMETACHSTVLIQGPLNRLRMHQHGFPPEMSEWIALGYCDGGMSMAREPLVAPGERRAYDDHNSVKTDASVHEVSQQIEPWSHDGRMDMPREPLVPSGEGQADDDHMQIDASVQEISEWIKLGSFDDRMDILREPLVTLGESQADDDYKSLKIDASVQEMELGSFNGRMGIPREPLMAPGEGQTDDDHKSMKADASVQEMSEWIQLESCDGRMDMPVGPLVSPGQGQADDDHKCMKTNASVHEKFKSGDFKVILRKTLTKSDVAKCGRIVLPKKVAQAYLPRFLGPGRCAQKLQMLDLVHKVTLEFSYKLWPSDKSDMYVLERAGDFLKTHGLEEGDILVIYKNFETSELVVHYEQGRNQERKKRKKRERSLSSIMSEGTNKGREGKKRSRGQL